MLKEIWGIATFRDRAVVHCDGDPTEFQKHWSPENPVVLVADPDPRGVAPEDCNLLVITITASRAFFGHEMAELNRFLLDAGI